MPISSTVFIFLNLLCIQTLTASSSKLDSSTTKCIDKERSALLKFKNSLTDGPGRLSSWTGQECCSWEGITCSTNTRHVLKLDLHNPTPFDIDRFYNAQDSAYIANYSKTCLSGPLNPALLDLKNLLFLDLSYNNFSNLEIPRFFGGFENLQRLNLSVARFQGTVPFQIGNLTRLQFLDMSDFWNNGLFSHSLKWASTLSSLRHLDLSGVELVKAKDWLDSVSGLPYLMKLNLSGTLIPSIFPMSRPKFTSLVSLDLQWNTIDSELPSWLFNIPDLVELRLDGNGFYGPIPQDFARLPSLSVLGLSSNFFNASLPDSLFTLTNLSYLDLSQNRLQGTLPNYLLHLCSLIFLDLTQNGFTGGIPDLGASQSGCLRNLEYLRISYNRLGGPVPSTLGSLTLRELDISNNLFTGTIPSSLGQLSNLVKLDISNNSLSGIVNESHFAKLSKLTELSMFANKLVFNISSNWIPPFQLQTIKLSSCNLGPLFPSWLRTQQDVVELRMSKSGILDALPDWFAKLFSRVHYLDVSKNNISGRLPEFEEEIDGPGGRRLILNSNNFHGALRPLPSDVLLFDVSSNMISDAIPAQNGKDLTLEVLILSNNKLNGSLPDFLYEIEGMMILDVANNQFSGQLPSQIGNLQNLAVLDLTNNTFDGEIPQTLANLQLNSLNLHNNNFHGQLPSLQNMQFLNILDVGKNSFAGAVPSWIGANMRSLAFLSLQNNRFHGAIPATLCELPQLQLLNLAGNNIAGAIPPCLGNFSAMIAGESSDGYLTLDVDYGASIYEVVSGMERLYTKTMPFLTSVDLSDNGIAGEVPENLTRLAGLRNLNLAGNELTGRIPEKIGEMKELVSLDLSRNRISGRIPAGLSELNFLSYLNLSYNELSGRIPAGEQLRTMDPSSFMGNDGLCGAPLARLCDGDAPGGCGGGDGDGDGGGDDGDSLFPWFYAGMGPGFLVGFLVVCGVLHFVRVWRYAFFQFVENVVGKWW